MRNIWTIARREYHHYFISPLAYAVAFAVLLVMGIFFVLSIIYGSQQSFYGASDAPTTSMIIGPMVTIFLLGTPALTMRLLADEQRMGTLELLLTAPVQDWELVVGKWFGSFLFALSVIAISLIYPITLNRLVSPGIDQGLMIANYLGVILIVAVFLAIGTAISSFFSNQFAAFFVTLISLLLLWWMMGWPAIVFQSGPAYNIFHYLDLSAHFDTMMGGVISLGNLLYTLSLTALGLFLGSVAVEARRWR